MLLGNLFSKTMCKIGIMALVLILIVVAVVLTTTFARLHESSESIIDYYERMILRNITEYELPKDANKYKPVDDTIQEYGSFDFIVIGAGSTGAVIANRLSEVSHWNVLLLDAGTFPNNMTDVPALSVHGYFSDYNWGFKTVPQTTACLGVVDRRCIVPRGRGLGGTTLFNGLVYSRGHRMDYNKLADLLNDTSWSFDKVLPYFKKSEDFHHTDSDTPVDYKIHGYGGYWNVEYHHPSIDLKYLFIDANLELGYNFTDFNAPDKSGAAIKQYNSLNGRRHDQGTAFVVPVMFRPNLQILTESYVTRLEIDNITKEVTGVLFTNKNQTYRAAANKEVILSAGVISTPQILMLSGVGPQQHLEDLSIPVVQNLSVGLSLRDHVILYGLQFSSNITFPEIPLREQIKQFLNGTGPLTSDTKSNVIGWYQSGIEQMPDYPDLEVVLDPASTSRIVQAYLGWSDETWEAIWEDSEASFWLNPLVVHTHSTGTIKLNSSNPYEYPLIDHNFLSDQDNKDIEALYQGINLCLSLINTTTFQRVNATFIRRPLPACSAFEFLSKDYWYCYIRYLSSTVFHGVGSCPTGTDPSQGAVVDSNLRVFGISKLRVADSSVFPFTFTSHPSADCAMIGEKISDVIKFDHL